MDVKVYDRFPWRYVWGEETKMGVGRREGERERTGFK